MYVVATRITFICPMKFNAFPMDIQVCMFQVGGWKCNTRSKAKGKLQQIRLSHWDSVAAKIN